MNIATINPGFYALQIKFTHSTSTLMCVCSVLSMFSDVRNLLKTIYADGGKISLMADYTTFNFLWYGDPGATDMSQLVRNDDDWYFIL